MEVLKTSNGIEFLGYYNEAFDSEEIPQNITNNKRNVNDLNINDENSPQLKERDGKVKQIYNTLLRRNNAQKLTHPINQSINQSHSHLDIVSINVNSENQIEVSKIEENKNKHSYLQSNLMNSFKSESKSNNNNLFKSYENKAFNNSSENIQDDLPPQDPIGWSNDEKSPKKISMQHIYNDKPILWTQIFGAISSATVHLAVGCIIGFTGVTLPSLMDPLSDDIVLDKYQASIFSSIVNIGAIAGSVLSSLMMTWLGQRSTLLVYLPIGIVFWIAMSLAQSFWLLILSRVIQGIVMGVCAGCANNYVVETVHKNVRGRLMALTDLCRQVGFLFMYIVGSSGLSWRNVGLICGIISMAFPFIGMIFLPHSPRWLALYGRKDEARSSLIFFRGKNYDVDAELNEIYKQIENNSKGASVLDQLKMMTERSIAFRLCILGVLLFASHFTGNFALIAYSVSIFESAEVDMSPYLSTIIVACSRIIGIVTYITIADKFKRRPLFMIPLSLSGVSMLALGSYFYVKTHIGDTSHISWLPLTSVICYVIFTMMSHPVLMLLRSELLPTSVRSVGVGILYLAFFLGTFGVSLSYPYMVDSVGSHWTFWLYGSTSFLMVLITALTIPETQGKSLEDIGNLFAKKKSPENA